MTRSAILLAGHVKLLVLVGGGAGCLAAYPSLLPDAVVVFDVAAELARYDMRRCLKPNWLVPLAFSQTTASLLRRASEAFRQAVGHLPNVVADHGLAQEPMFGMLAAIEYVTSAAFQRLADEVAAALTSAANGTVASVTLEFHASLCGGTGCLSSIVIASHFRDALRARLAPVIEVRFRHIGAQTYQLIGRRTQKNAAAGLIRHLGALRESTGSDFDAACLSITEFHPRLGKNKTARQSQVAQHFQATSCQQYENHVGELRPNWTTESTFGNVCLERIEFFYEVTPEAVTFDVAPSYESDVSRMLHDERADFSRVEVKIDTKVKHVPRPSIRRIIAIFQCTEMTREGLLALISEPGMRIQCLVLGEFSDGRRVNLHRVASEWSHTPTTIAEARERLMTYRTCLESLKRLMHELTMQKAELTAQAAWQSRWTALLARQVKPQNLLDALLSMLTSTETQVRLLQKHAKQLRRTRDDLQRVRCKLQAVRRARKAVRAKQRLDRRRLRGLAAMLKELGPSAAQQHEKPLVKPKAIDAVWTALWEFREFTKAEKQQVLLDAVEQITIDGLAQVAGCREADLAAIARALVTNDAPNPAPFFAGKLRLDQPDVVLVLPPLAEADVRKIQDHFDTVPALSRMKVVACDSAIAGLAIVKVSHYVVREYTEILTERVQHDLKEAWEKKDAYGLTDELLGLIGLEMVNGQIEPLNGDSARLGFPVDGRSPTRG
jgi:hypothetical protein